MGHIRQTIHNLLGKVLPRGGTPRVPGSYTLANSRADAKTNLNETHVLDGLAPRDAVAALVAMAPMIADRDVPDWGIRLAELVLGANAARVPAPLRREAHGVLVARWERLPEECRAVLAAGADLARAVRDSWAGAEAPARSSMVQALIAHAWPGASDVLIEALADPDPEVARAAGRGLETLALRALNEPDVADGVELLISRAVETFDLHQSRACLAAAVLIAGPGRRRGAAWAAAAEREELRPALGGALRSGVPAVFRERAWEHLAQEWIAQAAAARLSNGACGVSDHEAVLAHAHLVLRGVRRRTIAGLPAREKPRLMAALAPLNAAVMNRLSPGAWCGMSRVMVELGDGAARRETFARAALGHPDARVRFAAMRAAPGRTVVDYAFDADEAVARSAALEAASGPAPWARMLQSPHAPVRRVAAQEAGLAGLTWGPSCAEVLGLRRRLAADGAGLERAWREAWEAAEAADRIMLMRAAGRIGLLARVGDVVAAAAAPDAEPGAVEARVAATAASVLGSGAPTEEARRAVAACLEAKDARVRANAVEAVGLRADAPARALPAAVVELTSDANHRVRANAVRVLACRGAMEGSKVLRELARMLVSPEELDRRAGVWLAGRVGAAGGPLDASCRRGVATIIERRLAKEDDARVAERLRRCAARLVDDAAGPADAGPVLVEAA